MIDNQQRALIVDPGVAAPVFSFLTKHQLTLSGILITHHHWDHTNGVTEIIADYPVPVFGPQNEPVAGMTNKVGEGDIVSFPNFPLQFSVLDIPGHTKGHIAYYASGILFCGDTLFAAGCGRLFEGTAEQLYSSLQKMAALPDETAVYCAHEYTLNNLRFAKTVLPDNHEISERLQHVQALSEKHEPTLPSFLSSEKLTNPFLLCETSELIKRVEQHAGKPLANPVDVFAALRKWKDNS